MLRMLMRQDKWLPLVEGIFDIPDGVTLVAGIVEQREQLPAQAKGTVGFVIVDNPYVFWSYAQDGLLNAYVGKQVTIVLRNGKPTVEGGTGVAEA